VTSLALGAKNDGVVAGEQSSDLIANQGATGEREAVVKNPQDRV
jgi:hypothetical protein